MASTDARPIPIKNTALRITFPIYDADGDLVTGAAGLDSEVSKDGGTFTDCTNEATEIATSSGMYYLDLTSTEMNADTVAIIVKTSTSGAKTTVVVLYPQESGDVKVDVESIKTQTVTCAAGVTVGAYVGNATAAIAVDASGRLDVSKMSGTALTARDIGASVLLSSGTGTGQISLSSGAVTVGTNNDKTGYSLTQAFPTNFASMAITAGGAVTAGTVSDKTGYSLASGGLAAVTAWTVNITGSLSGSVGSVSGAVGSVTGNVGGNVTGSVGSISGITFPTNFALLSINGSGYVTYANAAPPTAAAIASQVRTELTTELGRIDVATSTRLASASYSAPPSAATISSTVWSETSRTLTAFSFTVTTTDSSNVSAIKAKTDNLPIDPADASDVAAAFSTVNLTLATIAGYVDTEVAAIKAKTDNLPASPAATSDIPSAATIASQVRTELATELARVDVATSTRASQTSVDDLPTNAELATALAGADDATLAAIAALSIPTAIENADAVLSRGIASVEGTADAYSLCTIVLAALESSVIGTTWTIKRSDGTTTYLTKTVTVDAAAHPITGVT